jgi:pyoverdine/dityrosine biosynthesis protein Dit1
MEMCSRSRISSKPSDHHRQLYNGIHRFLFEDQVVLQPHKSRTQVRNECKGLAYHVIQRSNAWSRLIAECFPNALRLSIHPQDPHAEKIGILLTEAEDNWLTPWHGVVVLDESRFKLMRRQRAEELGAKVVERDGRASHYETAAPEPRTKGGKRPE